MDAAFFRYMGPELIDALRGVRIDTVYGPSPGFWTFCLTPPRALFAGSPAEHRFLLLRSHTRDGAVLLSPVKPANPATPPAKAMWLRKRLRGRKLLGGATDWPRRRIALELSPGEGNWLLLTMEDDPVVLDRLPDGFGSAPGWASPEEALEDQTCPRSLRRALEREETEERGPFLEAFLEGRASGFFLNEAAPLRDGPLPWPPGGESLRFQYALEAALAYGQTAYFAALAPPAEDPAKAHARAARRLAHLDQDQRRLEELVRQQLYGEAVAANLSTLGVREKIGPKPLEHPGAGLLDVPFDPSLTVLENMERFFRKAAKGRRGQAHVARLRGEAERGELPPPKARQPQMEAARPVRSPKGGNGGRDIPVHRFRSSDGFLILRGKNSAANHKLLSETASPFDYWFHAEGGPGAHVILKRDSPGQTVPESSLFEAAQLAGLASWRSADSKATVLVAQCAEVRKMKGAALGQVRLSSAKTLLVELDPALEERLRLDT